MNEAIFRSFLFQFLAPDQRTAASEGQPITPMTDQVAVVRSDDAHTDSQTAQAYWHILHPQSLLLSQQEVQP